NGCVCKFSALRCCARRSAAVSPDPPPWFFSSVTLSTPRRAPKYSRSTATSTIVHRPALQRMPALAQRYVKELQAFLSTALRFGSSSFDHQHLDVRTMGCFGRSFNPCIGVGCPHHQT